MRRLALAFRPAGLRPGLAVLVALAAQLAALVALGWLLGRVVLAVLGTEDPRIDESIVRYFADHRTPWLTTLLRVMSQLGSTTVLIPLVIVVGFVAEARTRSWSTMVNLAVALGGAIALYDILKPILARARPDAELAAVAASGYAFPSGHSTQVSAVAVTLAVLGAARASSSRRQVAIRAAAALVVVTVGFSRVYLGAHWPTDVLAGCSLGALWATATVVTLGARHPNRAG